MEIELAAQLATLGHPQRLRIWRLLMRRYPDALPAGEIAEATGLKNSTLSVYLSALRKAALITQDRLGTSLRYRAEVGSAAMMLNHLFADCCRSRPELCFAPLAAPRSVLFLCTGNSARSLMAEALLRDLGAGRFAVHSAGKQPAGAPHPLALEVLRAQGHDTDGLHSKGFDAVPEQVDVVLTLCDRAANEDCPAFPGQPLTSHWGLPDPVTLGDFQQTYAALHQRLTAFLSLAVDTHDRAALQRGLDAIAHTGVPA
ncbi:arsenate reductase/protein-tyrosine-phosphatase family protein [Pseudooceanicola spongiae]|uniref:Helix-turn-helix domain-containing protein n=1 Tax=Pseudooceanicola spongiae TaxID=2613965 RepID=A0A7L9WRW0_9RHOB|nr:helix-turn-helix domain-containing protein [Pseudooceanicola spongiae]QOL82258.1 helix-turn-helix domain-containing protein [Pseudooceanicola spongiae]